jgi:hypothetical protein
MTRSNNIISRLVDPKRCDASCALIQIEAADEIDRLRFLVRLWKNAAEAYERGSLGEGDQLIDEARKRSEPIDQARKEARRG